MKIFHYIITPYFLFFLIFSDLSAYEGTVWNAGIARANITPEESMWMAGYAGRNRPADGALHDLWAKALVLEDIDGERAVLIITDLIGFRKSLSDRIRKRLNENFGLSKAQIMG